MIFYFNFVLHQHNRRMNIPNLACIAFVSLAVVSCGDSRKTSDTPDPLKIAFKVEPAPEWTALFKRKHGWFGGDGIFAIPFSGNDSISDSTLFIFSDTMVGEIKDDSLQPGYVMVNNSAMMLKGREPLDDRAEFLINTDKGQKPATLFTPASSDIAKGDYYWLGDGFVNHAMDTSFLLFAYRIRNTNDGSPFPFREVGNNLIVIPKGSKFPYRDQKQYDLPFSKDGDSLYVSYGAGVLANTAAAGVEHPDEYIYVYGVRGKAKELLVSRVKASQVTQFSAWQFYNGSDWNSSPSQARAVSDSVSNELSVTPIAGGRYALIYQYAGLMPTIYMQTGDSPVGPFGPRQKIWSTSDDIKEKGLFTYNAKAHPAISKPGELLVSYNVNSFDFFNQIKKIPDLYRPRFVRIIFNSPVVQ